MKRFISAALAAMIISLPLAGCGGEAPSADVAEGETGDITAASETTASAADSLPVKDLGGAEIPILTWASADTQNLDDFIAA